MNTDMQLFRPILSMKFNKIGQTIWKNWSD